LTLVPTRPDSPSGAVADRPEGAATRCPFGLRALFLGIVFYAAFGKGFAYAGWPPIFVGELLLAVVLACALRPWAAVPRNGAALVTAMLGGLGAVQFAVDRLAGSVPLLETVRGLAPIYYCGFAFGAFALLRSYEQRVGRPAVVAVIERAMVRAMPWTVAAVAFLATLLVVEPEGLPAWPKSGVPLFFTKPWDISVALVLFAPTLAASRFADRFVVHRLVLLGMWVGTALLVTFRSRGALLALIVGLIVARPHAARVVKTVVAASAVVLVLYVTGFSVEVSGREVSYEAIGDAVQSMLGTGPEDDIGSNYVTTTEWRSDWWAAIWADVRVESMVLHGHGWGDNLALRYGVISPLDADDPKALRLPHNIFFSLAGRAGVVVAVAFLLVPVLTIASTFRARAGGPTPMGVQGARGAVAAAVATGLTDIYLESPQGGILVWSLIGFLWWTSAAPVPSAIEPGDRAAGHARL
jgi:hypothetical protein